MALNIIQTEEAQKKIRGKFEEISNSMTRQAGEKDLVKTIIADIAEEFELDKKHVAKMARVFHKDSFRSEVEEKIEFEILYETITGQKAE